MVVVGAVVGLSEKFIFILFVFQGILAQIQ